MTSPPVTIRGWLKKERIGLGAAFKKPKAVYVVLDGGKFMVYDSSLKTNTHPYGANLRAEYDLSDTMVRVYKDVPCRIYLEKEGATRYFEADSSTSARSWEDAIQSHIQFAKVEAGSRSGALVDLNLSVLGDTPQSSPQSSSRFSTSPRKASPFKSNVTPARYGLSPRTKEVKSAELLKKGMQRTSSMRSENAPAKKRLSLEVSFKDSKASTIESPPVGIDTSSMWKAVSEAERQNSDVSATEAERTSNRSNEGAAPPTEEDAALACALNTYRNRSSSSTSNPLVEDMKMDATSGAEATPMPPEESPAVPQLQLPIPAVPGLNTSLDEAISKSGQKSPLNSIDASPKTKKKPFSPFDFDEDEDEDEDEDGGEADMKEVAGVDSDSLKSSIPVCVPNKGCESPRTPDNDILTPMPGSEEATAKSPSAPMLRTAKPNGIGLNLTNFVMPSHQEKLSDEGYVIVPIPGIVIQTTIEVAQNGSEDFDGKDDDDGTDKQDCHDSTNERYGEKDTSNRAPECKVFVNICSPGIVVRGTWPVDGSDVTVCEKSNIGEAANESTAYDDLKDDPKWPNLICSPSRDEPETEQSNSIILKNRHENAGKTVKVYDIILHPTLLNTVMADTSGQLRDLLCERVLDRIEANYDTVLSKNYALPKMFKRYKGKLRTAFLPFKCMGNTLIIRKPVGFDSTKTFAGQPKKKIKARRGMDFGSDDGNVSAGGGAANGTALDNIEEEEEGAMTAATPEDAMAARPSLFHTPDSQRSLWRDMASECSVSSCASSVHSKHASAEAEAHSDSYFDDAYSPGGLSPKSPDEESGRLSIMSSMSDRGSEVHRSQMMRFQYQVIHSDGAPLLQRPTSKPTSPKSPSLMKGDDGDGHLRLHYGSTVLVSRRTCIRGEYWLSTSQGRVKEGFVDGDAYIRYVSLSRFNTGPRPKAVKILSTSFRPVVKVDDEQPTMMDFASGFMSIFGATSSGADDHEMVFLIKLSYPLETTRICKRTLGDLRVLSEAISLSNCLKTTDKNIEFPTSSHSISSFMTEAVDEMLEYVKKIESWLHRIVRSIDMKTCKCQGYFDFMKATEDDMKEVDLVLNSQALMKK